MRVLDFFPHTNETPLHFTIGEGALTIEQLDSILAAKKVTYSLAPEAREKVIKCRTYLDEKVARSEHPLYGITTGFGSLCRVSISPDDLTTLQENLIKSHSCTVGDEVPQKIVQLMLILKIHALSMGHSGVQEETLDRLIFMLNEEVYPIVYSKGSLGASGDLAPLASLFLPLIGGGEVYLAKKGSKVPAKKWLEEAQLKPIQLKSKEGLALLNGTQFMSSHGVYALILARRAMQAALPIAALSLEAYDGLKAPFYAGLHQVRPHKGQQRISECMRHLLEGSKLQPEAKAHVQDPYSFRCIPQVQGASYDTLSYVISVVTTEINSVTDNPTIFPDEDLIISGGNFHGEPLAQVYDFLAIALSEVGNISERRTAQLILGQRGLPEFLVGLPGLNSGYMIPQYAAAALVSQNKMYAYPASADSIVSSNGQEDHVSMGANAAIKLMPLLDNLYNILGIELMNATQAISLRGCSQKLSPVLQNLFNEFRTIVPKVENDVEMQPLIQKAADFV